MKQLAADEPAACQPTFPIPAVAGRQSLPAAAAAARRTPPLGPAWNLLGVDRRNIPFVCWLFFIAVYHHHHRVLHTRHIQLQTLKQVIL